MEVINDNNQNKGVAKFEVKYDTDMQEYMQFITKPGFKNNSNNMRGVFSHSGIVELPEINQNHRRFYGGGSGIGGSGINMQNFKSLENISIQ